MGIQKFSVAGLKKGEEEMSHILTQANSLAHVFLVPLPSQHLGCLSSYPSPECKPQTPRMGLSAGLTSLGLSKLKKSYSCVI